MSTVLMQATGLRKIYANGLKEVEVLKGIDLSVKPGEMAAIVGASGSGKTTLLQILGTLAPATGGQLLFKGSRLDQKNDKELAAFRNRSLGFIFQFHHLLPEFNAVENTMMPALIGGANKRHAFQTAEDLLVRVGLKDRLFYRVGKLSGGEQQMLAVGRALMTGCKLLLLDEPSMGLAPVLKYELFRKLKQLNEEGMTILLVEQNAKLALQLAHRGYVLDTGNIAAEGTGQELLENPEVKKAYLGG